MAAEPDYRSGTPWPDIDLDGVVTEDMNASLKDNFALAVNKEKILKLQIPQGFPYAGLPADLTLQANEDLKKMFQGPAPEEHDAKLAYDYYHLLMDWDSRNVQGAAPLKKITDKVEAISSTTALSSYLANMPASEAVATLWKGIAQQDFVDSSRNVLMLAPPKLLLEDSAEYSHLTDYGAIKKKAASELAGKMLVKLGYTKETAQKKIENCFALEAKIAPSILTNEEQKSHDVLTRFNNRFSQDKLKDAQGKLPILEKLKKNGYPEMNEYVVLMPSFFQKLNELYTEENLPLFKDFLIVHGAVDSAEALDRECYEWYYEQKNAISGAKGKLPDEEVFAVKTADALEWPVAQLYSKTYLKKADKERKVAKNVREANKPVDKTIWCMTPQEVNCRYHLVSNSIHIAGAFAQGAMYNSNMSDEELLATLRRVIGHEISHAFDSNGAQFDKDGNMKNWWTKEDYAAFRARNDKMIAYFDKMHPWAGQYFYGSIMTGEACADMAGVKAVLRIAATKKNFDYDKFYRAYAASYLTKDTLQFAYVRINDVHPMCYLRINSTLQQFDEFLNFYGITEGDGMYLAPKDRVAIW